MAAGGTTRRGNSPWSSATTNAQRPRPGSDAGLRFLEWALFGVMVLLLAVLVGLPAMTEAANPAPSLALTLATGPAGSVVTASGANFGHTTVQLTWDGSANGMPSVQVGGNGSFKTTFTIPSTAATGPHQVQASGTSTGGSTNAGGKKNSTSLVSASAIFTVAIFASTPTPTATPAPTSAAVPTPTAPSASGTPAPTTAPTATPTAAVTPASTATPTGAPTPTPKPTSTPAPTATQTASITANPTSITSGGTTTISGVGMPGSSAVLVLVGSGNFTTTSTGNGAFSVPIDIESATSGPQTVTATSGTITASTVVQLTVTATPTPTPTATPTPTPIPTATLTPTAAGKPVLCAGPARVGAQIVAAGTTMSCGTVDAQGATVAVEMQDNSTLYGVEIFNTSASYGGGIIVNGNGVNIHDCFVHNTGNEGININRDGDANGIKNLTLTNCLIQDTGGDSIHIKGTNRGDGQAPTQAAAMENIRITYTKSVRSNGPFSFEFQDGQLNCYFAYNDADRQYSVVGHTGLQMLNNTVTTTMPWGYEVGNMIGSTWDNNLSTGSTEAGFAFTGDTVTSNMNTTYSNNRVSGGSNGFELHTGSYNTFTNNGFHNVTTWFWNNGIYDASHDVTTGSYPY